MTLAGAETERDDAAIRLGLMCGVAAYLIWGFFPVYIRSVASVAPAEIVAHRILWSVPFGALLIALRRQWGDVFAAASNLKVLGTLAIAALAITANWLLYVYAVSSGRVLEASLGYYINPLTFIAAGVFVLHERLSRTQIVAVALAALGVLILTVGVGAFPWISIILACSFGMYGYLRKTAPVGALPGLFIETCLLSPAAAFYLFLLAGKGALAFGAQGTSTDLLLVLAGPITVAPLVLFALAARRLKLSTLGFLQYIAPTGQFLLGLHYGEKFTVFHGACFGLIWLALALISFDAVRRNRAERLARAAAGVLPVNRSLSESRQS